MTGHVSFVGAGPGAPDLLTLRAVRALGEADVVVWARSLVDEGILEHGNGEDYECDQAQRKKFEDEPGLLGLLRLYDSDHAHGTGTVFVEASHEHGRDYG